jgi:hypothetical protein
MQSFYAEHFEREMGCTEAEWLRWLPQAMGMAAWLRAGTTCIHADVGPGQLVLGWRVLTPRALGLVRIPRLAVTFQFSGLDAVGRLAFMRHFDLYTQRGGG